MPISTTYWVFSMVYERILGQIGITQAEVKLLSLIPIPSSDNKDLDPLLGSGQEGSKSHQSSSSLVLWGMNQSITNNNRIEASFNSCLACKFATSCDVF